MRLILALFLVVYSLIGYTQPDSSVIKPFLDTVNFPNVDTIYYEINKRLNDKILSEGWTIEEKAGPNSTILKIEGSSEDLIMLHKIGVWKHYYKNGQIEAIDTINYEKEHRFGSQTFYNKDGSLSHRYVMTTKDKVPELRSINRDIDLDKKMFAVTILFQFDKNGEIKRKQIWEGDEKVFDKKY